MDESPFTWGRSLGKCKLTRGEPLLSSIRRELRRSLLPAASCLHMYVIVSPILPSAKSICWVLILGSPLRHRSASANRFPKRDPEHTTPASATERLAKMLAMSVEVFAVTCINPQRAWEASVLQSYIA